jgi:hypothetical protein
MGFQNGWRGPNIVADGLVMYLDAGSPNSYRPDFGTTWKDMSGFNNSGSLTNGPTYSTDNGGSIVFDGVNDWVNTPLNIDANPNTICAWCYPTAVTSTNGYGIVLTDNTNWDKGFEINGSLWQIHTGNNLISTGVTAFANIWQYGCISYTNTSMNFYLNGLMVWSGGSPGATAGSNVEIGRANYSGGNGSRFFVGKISNVSIYNRALSESEILQNYNAQKSRFGL